MNIDPSYHLLGHSVCHSGLNPPDEGFVDISRVARVNPGNIVGRAGAEAESAVNVDIGKQIEDEAFEAESVTVWPQERMIPR
jgi:hypothetical protein